MQEEPNVAVEEDTEEMRKWRGLSQSEMDQCWRNLAERIEEEVLDKYKVEEGKREAFRGGGNALHGGKCAKEQEIQNKESRREDCWAIIFSLFREYNLQRSAKQAG